MRDTLGFREPTLEDEDRLTQWLAAEVCPIELGEERQREALLARCRGERIEPPGPSRVDRVPAAAEQRFCAQTVDRLQAKAGGATGGAGHDGAAWRPCSPRLTSWSQSGGQATSPSHQSRS